MKKQTLKTKEVILKMDMPYIRTMKVVQIDKELIKRIEQEEIILTEEKDIIQILKIKDGELVIEEKSTFENQDIKSKIEADVKLKENDIIIKQERGYTKIKVHAFEVDKELKKVVEKINGYTAPKVQHKTK